MEQQLKYYNVIPEFNSAGRLCNYHTGGESETVRVMAEEWERFNQLAGRQHEIINGTVVFSPDLELCLPDDTEIVNPYAQLVKQYIHEHYSLDDELALVNDATMALDNGSSLPQEYLDYRAYVEECKKRAKKETEV